MQRPISKPVGTPVSDLDTPALVVNLDLLEKNIETMHSFFRGSKSKLRPHVSFHLIPAIAKMQLDAGGTVGGVSVTTVGQAEVFCENGVSDVLIANSVVTWPKIERICILAKSVNVTVAIDNVENVSGLSECAEASGVVLDVVVNIDERKDHRGVDPGPPVLNVVEEIRRASGLRFVGLMSYGGPILIDEGRYIATDRFIQQVLDTRELLERVGIDVEIVSVGGTHNYEISGTTDGITEVAAGSYVLMDERYVRYSGDFEPAARVMGVVTSLPEPGLAITDAGAKVFGSDGGKPVINNIHGATVRDIHAEHGEVIFGLSEKERMELGDVIWFTPWDMGTCINLNDYVNVVRGGQLESVWSVDARGRYS